MCRFVLPCVPRLRGNKTRDIRSRWANVVGKIEIDVICFLAGNLRNGSETHTSKISNSFQPKTEFGKINNGRDYVQISPTCHL